MAKLSSEFPKTKTFSYDACALCLEDPPKYGIELKSLFG